ncbi:phosphotransferase enzyme family protein [Caulobacter sp. KR2-114]|uniref:phosphotransferase enzyme family protein n=1 Tax=Caulobacter sp. KR2-114 TaxID=3400912 RepID=UPI003C0C81C6
MRRTGPRQVLGAFGLAPTSVRRISGRANIHWRVRAGGAVFVLRRFADGPQADASAAWEQELVSDLRGAGCPAPEALEPPRRIGDGLWLLMRHIEGRRGPQSGVSTDDYRALGGQLADLHALSERLPPRAQRPGWSDFTDAGQPVAGGDVDREGLLKDLRHAAPQAAGPIEAALAAYAARDLPSRFAGAPQIAVHGDFAPWNIIRRGGSLAGLIDFEMAHLDVAAADLAMSRRGYHDAVVEGYCARRPLPAAQLAALDALWTGSLLFGLWRMLQAWRRDDRARPADLAWHLEQLRKTRPYQG